MRRTPEDEGHAAIDGRERPPGKVSRPEERAATRKLPARARVPDHDRHDHDDLVVGDVHAPELWGDHLWRLRLVR